MRDGIELPGGKRRIERLFSLCMANKLCGREVKTRQIARCRPGPMQSMPSGLLNRRSWSQHRIWAAVLGEFRNNFGKLHQNCEMIRIIPNCELFFIPFIRLLITRIWIWGRVPIHHSKYGFLGIFLFLYNSTSTLYYKNDFIPNFNWYKKKSYNLCMPTPFEFKNI